MPKSFIGNLCHLHIAMQVAVELLYVNHFSSESVHLYLVYCHVPEEKHFLSNPLTIHGNYPLCLLYQTFSFEFHSATYHQSLASHLIHLWPLKISLKLKISSVWRKFCWYVTNPSDIQFFVFTTDVIHLIC